MMAGWRVPFVRPDVPAYAEVSAAIERAISSGMLTKGPELAALEAEAAAALGVRHVVGVSSCTVGVALVLKALEPRAGRTEIILPSFNFLAAPGAVVWAGFTPVFVEVDPQTFTIDPAAAAAAVTDRTAAIMACHTFGCPCDIPALEAVAARADVPLLVDAAHGLGTQVQGRQVGAGGRAQIFSLSPTKLVVAGEGGLVATDDDALAAAIRVAREYGNDGHYGCTLPGLNGRLPEISAILARASLARLPDVAGRRQAAAEAYVAELAGLPGIGLQRIPPGATSSWKDFVITVDAEQFGMSRDAVRRRLADAGVDTRAYYDPACHQMEAFRRYVRPGQSLPITDHLAATALALPLGAHVTPDVARSVAHVIRTGARS
jgi:dTDP-4-amino-4,6-dideoxygalactose transaminase